MLKHNLSLSLFLYVCIISSHFRPAHQHYTDEAQKAETVPSVVSYIYIYIYGIGFHALDIVYVVSLDKYLVCSCSEARVFRKIYPQREDTGSTNFTSIMPGKGCIPSCRFFVTMTHS